MIKNHANKDISGFFSNKKTVIQFVLSLLVFYIHFRVFSTFEYTTKPLSTLLDALMSLTSVAVPLFFAISGALFYRDYTLNKTLQKWKSRFFSLCVPYLIWNTIWLILALLGYYTPLGDYLGGVKTPLTLESILTGIFLHGFFEPFWFILRLIELTILCPVIYLILRNKVIGLSVIGAWIALMLLGIDNIGGYNIRQDKIIMYFIGAWVGMHHFDWVTCRRSKKQAIICLMIYIICSFFMGTKHLLPQWMPVTQIECLVIIISSIAFYVSFDLFSIESSPSFMKESFLIYAMHSLIGAALSKIIRMLLPEGNIYTLLTAVIVFPTTIVFICTFAKLLGRYTPKLKKVLAGR